MQRLPRLTTLHASARSAIGVGYLLICLAALLAAVFVGPLGYAPFPLPFARTPEPVVVTVWYGGEKRAWLEDAVARFAATAPRVGSRPVRIVLRGVNSREQALRVAREDWRGDGAPAVVSPDSGTWVEALRAEWAARSPGAAEIVAGGPLAPVPLVVTPLVAVAWEERGELIWGAQPGAFWPRLHDALAQPSWSALGGGEAWGPVKLGQASPSTSDSGAQALVLLGYGFHGATAGLSPADAQSPELAAWLATFQGAVPQFSDSTDALMTAMLQRGPSVYDVALVPESLAIEAFASAGTWGRLRIYYPPATLVSDHPYAILDAPWTTADERQGARLFRDFLLSRPVQERALTYGFRPANAAVPVATSDPRNPFNQYQPNGLRADLPALIDTPTPAVVEALLQAWQRASGR
jgi:ABC-type Fe3+ transport system substrate-binding protein